MRLLLVQQEWISGCVLRAGGFPPPFPEADRFYFCSCTRGNVSKTQALGVREFISPPWKIKAFGLQERTIQRHGTALTWSPAAAISSFMPVPPRDRGTALPCHLCCLRYFVSTDGGLWITECECEFPLCLPLPAILNRSPRPQWEFTIVKL